MKNKSKQPSILNKINSGWNLGNFLDSHDKSFCWENTKSKNIQNIINLWHNPIFNLKCLDTLKNKGINCIRIPITWCNFINIYKNNISISRDFISYLTKIIDSAIVCAGAPTMNNQVYPAMADILTYVKGLRPKNKIGFAFGSFGWSGEGHKYIQNETYQNFLLTSLENRKKVQQKAQNPKENKKVKYE